MQSPLLCFLFLLLVNSSAVAQYLYEDISAAAGIANPGNKNRGIAFADYDNDGDQDLYAFTRLGENHLYENLGNNNFSNVAPQAGVNYPGSTRAAVWGDVNNDGWVDLYLGNYQENDLLYLNNGPDENGQVTFTDVTLSAGILNTGESISAHMADIDNDGWLDIYVANFLGQNHLYYNNGPLAGSNAGMVSFSNQTFLRNAADDSFSMGCLFFDYDNDGDQDLYLVHDFLVPNILYQNDGNGYFTNVAAAAGAAIAGHGMGVDAADVNRDGWLDLYITDLDENFLLLNNGNGTFSDISDQAGITDTGMGWGTIFLDFDNDGWTDIYVLNDSNFSPEPNVLYRNNGNLSFTAVELNGPVASSQGSIGGACADINGDGAPDIAIANSGTGEGNQLFRNSGTSNNWIGFRLSRSQGNSPAIGARVSLEYGQDEFQLDEVNAGSGFAGANATVLHFGLKGHSSVAKATVRWPNGVVQEFFNLTAGQVHDFLQPPVAQLPVIHSVTPLDSVAEKWGRFEAVVNLSAAFSNPYNYDEIWVKAVFTGPSGQERTVDGFYMQNYSLNTSTGGLTQVGAGEFRLRFSPDEPGAWTFTVSATDIGGTATADPLTFVCTEAAGTENHGFVRTNQTNYLQFDDGSPYVLIGENICWQNSNAYNNYKTWLGKLVANGGNFFRLWHAHWGLGIEWKEGLNSFQGLRRYKQNNCYYQDWLYDFCAENGVHVMLALQHHGQVSTGVNPNWNESPYNAANGGPCQNTWNFFTNEEAKAHTRNRLRYIVARWGHSRAIMSWELFNEVEWTDNFNTWKEEVADWHFEMAAFLKSIDPYGHIVTTSYAHDNLDPAVWSHPDMDITQTHYYINTPHIERALASGNKNYLADFGKPTLNGEFGLGGSADLANQDPNGIHLHNSLWGGLFSGAMGTAMTWWWDNYVHPKNLYYHFAPVAAVADAVPFLQKDLRPAEGAYVSGTSGDLVLTPSIGWGVVANNNIQIDENGTVTPAGGGLSQYLYGAQWNTQFRSPPVFYVNMPQPGQFRVRTGSTSGQSPKIAIYLNGALQLQQNATVNNNYVIPLPAGQHAIKVDNLGTDWITIASYTITGIGSQVDNYTLVSEDKTVVAGWLLNNRYNHENVLANGQPDPAEGGQFHLSGVADGDYFVKWYNCLTGAIFEASPVTVTGGELSFPVPPLAWDAAFLLDGQEVTGASERLFAHLPFQVYPNPAQAGGTIQLDFGDGNGPAPRLSLLDMAGRELQALPAVAAGSLQLPADLPSGMYWLKASDGGGRVGVQAVVVKRG